jgi:hypothetical protein
LICVQEGIPVSFDLWPAAEQDLTPVHELTFVLRQGATVLATKAMSVRLTPTPVSRPLAFVLSLSVEPT